MSLIFLKIKKNLLKDDEIKSFYSYFETNFIGSVESMKIGRGRGVKIINTRTKPLFPISFWNVNS